MDRGVWRATVHRVTKSQAQLKQLCTHAHKCEFLLLLKLYSYSNATSSWFANFRASWFSLLLPYKNNRRETEVTSIMKLEL